MNGFFPHRRFEEQVVIFAENEAVFTENSTYTYEQLNLKANQLADYLQGLGIKPRDAVGVCTTHEPERVLALIALCKLGAVYVPVDPFYPADLINYMTNKVEAKIILTNRSELLERKKEFNASAVPFAYHENKSFALSIVDSDPMYCIFTSGSTGRPKAVAVSHRAAYNHFAWVMDYTKFTTSDIWLQTINPSFDPSMHELMAPLMIGGRIALIGGVRKLDSREIADAIIRHKASHITTVPTMLTLLVNTPQFRSCVSLKQVCVGGEVFRPALAEKAMSELPNTQFHNVYGPTEATIMASGWPISEPEKRDALPIGPAIYNMKFYLKLDSGDISELAPGLEGELCISGISLANGYVHDEAKTREVFIDNPLETSPGSIYKQIYLSGDRCRVDSEGNLFCLGRLDGQVKINGQRVELAEIEYQFSTLEDIRDVAVFKIEQELVAALVPVKKPLDEKEWFKTVRAALEKKLPSFMLPKRMVVLDAIPGQEVSAKADRKKLFEILSETMKKPVHMDATTIQEKIAKLIEANVADSDVSFADLGLDSVDLQMLTLKLNQQFSLDLKTEALFEYYTIEKLSEYITHS